MLRKPAQVLGASDWGWELLTLNREILRHAASFQPTIHRRLVTVV